jgi:quinol monooxygenase YgiN
MATLLAHIKIRPGQEARFERVAEEMYRRSHADEPGLRRYEYWRGEDPGTYYTLESFDEYLGFLNHQTSAHHEEAGPSFGEMIESMRLEWLDPITTASPLVATEPQELPEGSSQRLQEYDQRHHIEVPPWWREMREGEGT